MFYRLLSKLLEYPDQEMLDAVPELEAALQQGFADAERAAIAGFLRGFAAQDLTEAKAAYVQTFDLTPEHALHLTHHLFGDDKNRGPALIDLTEYYKQYGFEITPSDGSFTELPDYLPLVLEFAAQLEPEEARMFLSQWNKVLNQLAANLEKADSPYAPLVRLVEQHSRLVQPAAEATA
jgi:nitrate reductase delta subunit